MADNDLDDQRRQDAHAARIRERRSEHDIGDDPIDGLDARIQALETVLNNLQGANGITVHLPVIAFTGNVSAPQAADTMPTGTQGDILWYNNGHWETLSAPPEGDGFPMYLSLTYDGDGQAQVSWDQSTTCGA